MNEKIRVNTEGWFWDADHNHPTRGYFIGTSNNIHDVVLFVGSSEKADLGKGFNIDIHDMHFSIDDPRKAHQELKELFKAGASIQFLNLEDTWEDIKKPLWHPDTQYREKPLPEIKPDIPGYVFFKVGPMDMLLTPSPFPFDDQIGITINSTKGTQQIPLGMLPSSDGFRGFWYKENPHGLESAMIMYEDSEEDWKLSHYCEKGCKSFRPGYAAFEEPPHPLALKHGSQ